MSSRHPVAPHVQAAIARAAQPRTAEAMAGGRQMAPHVQQAVAGPVQARLAVPGGRQPAPHVQAAIARAAQPRFAGEPGGGRQMAPHVQQAVAGPAQAREAATPAGGRPPAPRVQQAAARTAQPRTARAAAIQTQIDYRKGARVRVMDPVDSITKMLDFGVTPVLVNHHEFPGTGNARQALTPPALHFETTKAKTAVSVAAVAAQDVTYRMELPRNPPWIARVSKDLAKSAIEMQLDRGSKIQVPIGKEEKGTIDLQVKGLPDDLTFAELIETHEEVHVHELAATVREILRPWDEALQRLQREGVRFEANTPQAAEAALYRAVGGTPQEVGERFLLALRNTGRAFHGRAAGGSPKIARVEKSLLGGTLYVFLRHPPQLGVLHAERQQRRHEEELRRRALDRIVERWNQNRALGDPSVNSSGEGNRYILNEML